MPGALLRRAAALVEASDVGCPLDEAVAAAVMIGGVGTTVLCLLASSDELAALDAFEFCPDDPANAYGGSMPSTCGIALTP
jgi:hypothetical protein